MLKKVILGILAIMLLSSVALVGTGCPQPATSKPSDGCGVVTEWVGDVEVAVYV